jgi:hypothetical protein
VVKGQVLVDGKPYSGPGRVIFKTTTPQTDIPNRYDAKISKEGYELYSRAGVSYKVAMGDIQGINPKYLDEEKSGLEITVVPEPAPPGHYDLNLKK